MISILPTSNVQNEIHIEIPSQYKEISKEKTNDNHHSHPQLQNVLSQFDGYKLTDLKNANLMNRVDSKFLLPMSFLPELLKQMKTHYRVLDIDGKRSFTYENKYFDTPFLDLYHAHHNGKLNRYKVRSRCYVDTGTEYLEVKLKNNHKRTIKTRIKLTGEVNQYLACNDFINSQMNGQVNNLEVSQQSGYQRIALANEEKAERLTLDFDLWYSSRRGTNKVKLPEFFIAELKQSKKSKRSPFYQLMSKNHIHPVSFSKYCIGCALLYKSSIKTNKFKPILTKLETYSRTVQPSSYKSN